MFTNSQISLLKLHFSQCCDIFSHISVENWAIFQSSLAMQMHWTKMPRMFGQHFQQFCFLQIKQIILSHHLYKYLLKVVEDSFVIIHVHIHMHTVQYTKCLILIKVIIYLFKKILLTVPPKIHATENHYRVVENSRAVLSCVADGMPAPSVTWRKGDTSPSAKLRSEPYEDFIIENAKVSFS